MNILLSEHEQVVSLRPAKAHKDDFSDEIYPTLSNDMSDEQKDEVRKVIQRIK